jgi:hypothetical protein
LLGFNQPPGVVMPQRLIESLLESIWRHRLGTCRAL